MRNCFAGDFATSFLGVGGHSAGGLPRKNLVVAQDMWFLRRTGEFSQIIDQPGKRIPRWPAFGILFLHSPIQRMHIRPASKWIENAFQD